MDGLPQTEETSCPSDEILLAVLSLQSEDELTVQVREHLGVCDSCQLRLDQLTSSPDLKAVHKQSHCELDDSARRLVTNIAKEFSHKLVHQKKESAQQLDTLHVVGDTEVASEGFESDGLDIAPTNLPKVIGRYTILKELGRGGSGVVYLAFDPEINRKIALKRIHSSRTGQKNRLIREAKAAARLQIDQVVRVFSIETDEDDNPFITMEYIEGNSLADEIKNSRYLSTKQAVKVCSEVATAIQAAHEIGMLHRDVKPGNILLDKLGNAKLADFGLAYLGESVPQLTKTGVLLGTPSYMSPEQANGTEIDARSDIYSLGCVLYEALTGSMPFYGTTHQVLKQIAEDQPASILRLNENLPKSFHVITRMAMAKRPENRYQSADDFRDDINAAINGDAIKARPETALEMAMRWYRKNKKVAWLSGTVGFLLVLTTVISLVSAQSIARESHKAIRASEESKRLAVEANEQRQLAVETLNELVFNVQQQLKGKPGTLKVKQSILETALEGLKKVVPDEASTTAINHANSNAYLRMANIEIARGNDQAAAEYFESAKKIAQRICELDQDDLRGMTDLGTAMIGLVDLKIARFEYESALEPLQDVLEVRKSIVETAPTLENQFDYARVYGRIATAEAGLGQLVKALASYESAIEIMKPFQDQITKDPLHARSYAVALSGYTRLLIMSKQIERAEANLEELVSINERLLELDPFNSEYLLDAAVVYGQISQIHFQGFEWEQADKFATKTRKTHEKIVETNPENDWSRSNLGYAWSAEAAMKLALNDVEAARFALEQGYRLQLAVLDNNSNNARFILAAAGTAFSIANIDIRNGDLEAAMKYAQEIDGLIDQLPEESLSTPIFESMVTGGKILPKVLASAIAFLENQDKELKIESDDQKSAAAMIADQFVRREDFQKALTIANRLDGVEFDSPVIEESVGFTLAVIYTKLLANAHETNQGDESKNRLLDRAIQSLDSYMANPLNLHTVMAEPELEFIRGLPEFKQAMQRWGQNQ